MSKATRIYIASKTKHAPKWLELRSQGVDIISTWIDEAGEGQSEDMRDLCKRCIEECLNCNYLIVYRETDDYLKGAFIEMGIVLSRKNIPVLLVGEVLPKGSAFTFGDNIFLGFKNVSQAIGWIEACY